MRQNNNKKKNRNRNRPAFSTFVKLKHKSIFILFTSFYRQKVVVLNDEVTTILKLYDFICFIFGEAFTTRDKELTCFVESNDDYKRGYFQLQLNSLAHLHSVMKNDMKTFFGKFYFGILFFKEIFF